jgi:hypothetical protein
MDPGSRWPLLLVPVPPSECTGVSVGLDYIIGDTWAAAQLRRHLAPFRRGTCGCVAIRAAS